MAHYRCRAPLALATLLLALALALPFGGGARSGPGVIRPGWGPPPARVERDPLSFAMAGPARPAVGGLLVPTPARDSLPTRLDRVLPASLAADQAPLLAGAGIGLPKILSPDRAQVLIVALCAAGAMLAAGVIWRNRQRSTIAAGQGLAAELIDSMPVGLLLIAVDGRVAYVNREILDATPGGPDVMRCGAHYPTAMKALIDNGAFDLEGRAPQDMLRLLAVEGLKDGFRQELRMADGSSFIRTARRLGNGETLIVRQDVTIERARLRQIEALNRTLAEKVRIATATNAELRAFAYATSHDLKSPLNSAIMLADLLLEEERQGERDALRDLITDLRGTLRGMSGLIDGVRLYTDAIVTGAPMVPCDLQAMAEEIVGALTPDLQVAGAEVTVQGLPKISGNAVQLRQLLSNLLDNALIFRAEGRAQRVALSGFDGPEEAGFAIRDNGIGIDPAHHERIFQLFQRLHPGALYPGNGLGLPICQRIVLAHGGRIAVESAPDRGAAFTVTFGKDVR
ncbi:sensor histidine kinase [Ponticoccus sp. (in: a-proteobacteria)]|uniref:sensor histidine kinase n=1 Tax=Ponticoccus sp. (in: a-proteobacteria) TaxID=1925025 RepID=UPI003AB73080